MFDEMPAKAEEAKKNFLKIPSERLLSLDVFRGMVMVALLAEGTEVYGSLRTLVKGHKGAGFLMPVIQQFFHHPWNGLRLWDLVQPAFMFIVGVAMVFSINKRWERGDTWAKTFGHIARRCLILFLLGTGLHCVYNGKIVWELWNVLTQLSVTVMITFLIMRLPRKVQFFISVGLILVSDLSYRFIHIPPYDQTFVADKNFGSWMDMVLMGKLSKGHWVAVNCITTSAHTIWGSLAGQTIRGEWIQKRKAAVLAAAGLMAVLLGYIMDWGFGVEALRTPIIKRICTSSFVIVSGGWCLLALALLFWLIEMKGWKRWAGFFAVVGMNSILIYLIKETITPGWLNGTVAIFVHGFLGALHISEPWMKVANAFVVLGLLWALCYFLYKRKIFIRI